MTPTVVSHALKPLIGFVSRGLGKNKEIQVRGFWVAISSRKNSLPTVSATWFLLFGKGYDVRLKACSGTFKAEFNFKALEPDLVL